MRSFVFILLLTLTPVGHAADDDDCDILAQLAEALHNPYLAKYTSAKTARGKLSAFKKADEDGQQTILTSLALARLQSRGTMAEVEMLTTMLRLVEQEGVSKVAAGNAVRHMISTFSSVKDPQLWGIELTSNMTGSGFLEAQSNASYNRGIAIEAASTLVSQGRCTEFEQLLLLKGLREAIKGSAYRPPMDFFERRYVEQALRQLDAPTSKLEDYLRPQLRELSVLVRPN